MFCDDQEGLSSLVLSFKNGYHVSDGARIQRGQAQLWIINVLCT